MFNDIFKKEDKKDSGEIVFKISKDLIQDLFVLHGEIAIIEIADMVGKTISNEIIDFVEYLKKRNENI